MKRSLNVDVLETYELPVSEVPAIPEDDPLVQTEEMYCSLVGSDQRLTAKGRINTSEDDCCDGVWGYRLLRRAFSIDSIDGEIRNMDVRYDWQRASVTEIHTGKIWISESWGSCRVYVRGDDGTSFRLLEFPVERS